MEPQTSCSWLAPCRSVPDLSLSRRVLVCARAERAEGLNDMAEETTLSQLSNFMALAPILSGSRVGLMLAVLVTA